MELWVEGVRSDQAKESVVGVEGDVVCGPYIETTIEKNRFASLDGDKGGRKDALGWVLLACNCSAKGALLWREMS